MIGGNPHQDIPAQLKLDPKKPFNKKKSKVGNSKTRSPEYNLGTLGVFRMEIIKVAWPQRKTFWGRKGQPFADNDLVWN